MTAASCAGPIAFCEAMTHTDPSKRSEAEIRAEARNWFVSRLAKIAPSEDAAFQNWRLADPAHDKAFRDVEAVWQSTEQPGKRLAVREADELAVYLTAMDRAKAQRRMSRRLAVTSVVLVALLGGGIWLERPNFLQNLMADYVTDRGERRSVTLSDGSTVLLDADSALDERFSGTERRITLLRGTAFFDVAAGTRPFIVSAANGEIRDIGTRFDVGLVDDGATVTLESGKVAVTIDGTRQQSILLQPGQRVRFSRRGAGPVESIAINDALAWHGGRYIFYRARLADVVAEIARYRRGRIMIASSALGDELVTGSFALADTDAALFSLQASVGFRMTSLTSALTVIGP